MLVGAIGLITVFIYGYSNYGLEFGKFFAAEPGSGTIQCIPAQQNAVSGGAVTFTAIASTPTPTPTPPPGCYYQQVQCIRAPCEPQLVCPSATPTIIPTPRGSKGTAVGTLIPNPLPKPTIPPVIAWTAPDGNPPSGTGTRFVTMFRNTGRTAITKLVSVQYGMEKAVCSVTVAPATTPTPTISTSVSPSPSGVPIGLPILKPSALPSIILRNGSMVLARFTSTADGSGAWLKRIAFNITKTSAISLNNGFRFFEDGVDISSLGEFFADPGILPGYTSTRVVYTSTNERPLRPGHLYELQATVSGVSGSQMSLKTDVLNASGTGAYQPMTYTNGLDNRNLPVSLVWTDHSAPNHSYSSNDWFSDRNIRYLPLTWSIWTP